MSKEEFEYQIIMNSIRQTDLNGFALCPAKIKLKAEFGSDLYAPLLADIGHFFHKCAEIYLNSSIKNNRWLATDNMMSQTIGAAALLELKMQPDHASYLHIKLNEWNKIPVFLDSLKFNWSSPDHSELLDLTSIIGVELPLKIQVSDTEVTMTLDEVFDYGEGHLGITDFKGKWHIPNLATIQQDTQFSVYVAGLALHMPPTESVSVRQSYYSLAGQQSPEVKFGRKEIDLHISRLEYLVAKLEEAYSTQDWPYQPGKHCAKCNHKLHCEAGHSYAQTTEPTYLMDCLHAAVAVKSMYWDDLRDWVAEHGPVEHNGEIAAVTQTKGGSFRLSVKEIKPQEGLEGQA